MTYLQQVENLLDLPPAEEAEVLRELESHLEDIRAELVDTGMDSLDAAAEAERRMGPLDDVALRLNAAHNTASWKSTILTALPFFAAFVLLFLPLSQSHRIWPVSAVFLITAFASIRELVRGRRPIWLSSWLAAALLSAASIIYRAVDISGLPANAGELNAGIISGLGIVVLACIATLAVHRWRLTIFISVIFFVCAFGMWRSGTLDASNIFTVLGFAAIRIASLVVFARAVLGLHHTETGCGRHCFCCLYGPSDIL